MTMELQIERAGADRSGRAPQNALGLIASRGCRAFGVISLCLAIAGCSEKVEPPKHRRPTQPTDSVTVTAEFTILETWISHGMGGSYLAFRTIQKDGKSLLCGTVFHKQARSRDLNRYALWGSDAVFEGKVLLHGLGYFASYDGLPFLEAEARCAPLSETLKPGQQVEIQRKSNQLHVRR